MGFFATRRSVFGVVRTLVLSLFTLLCANGLNAQVLVTPNQTATLLAQTLTGPGVTILNPTLVCPTDASGIYTTGALGSSLTIDSGIVLTSGLAMTSALTPGVNGAASLFASTAHSTAGDADLTGASGFTTNDACKLEFDFIPAGDTVKFDYEFGSEEYPEFACSGFNDVFAFFISGPGIIGQKNLALIPGTTIPVAINSVNSAPTGTSYPVSTCQTMGTGSPFNTYYINNSTSTTVTYDGMTVSFQAISTVTPCDTFHLKIAIADGGDASYDSGVFLKAGSLTSNAINITPVGGGGLAAPSPYVVRNCLPGQFVFNRPTARPTPLTIKYLIGGSAVNGVDYNTIPDSVIIPANGTQAVLNIQAVAPPNGVDSIKLMILSPYTCNGNPIIIDSATLIILDSIAVNIVNNDTAICQGQCVTLGLQNFQQNSLLNFNWLPTTGLNTTTGTSVYACPTTTTTYQVAATLPGSGCPPSYDDVTVTIVYGPTVNAGRDTTTCQGTPYTFPTTVTPTNQNYTWSWTPTAGLNNATLMQPTATAAAPGTTTYIVAANPGAAGCIGKDTVVLRVLPGDFELVTKDTAICKGASVPIRANGHPAYAYSWTSTNGVSNPFILTPTITPDTSARYMVTANFPGCPPIRHDLFIDVQPNPIVNVGPDRNKCQWDTLQFHSTVAPGWYSQYSYQWTPAADLDAPTMPNVVFSGQQDVALVLTVKTPAGCTGVDSANIIVRQGNFGTLTPTDTAICPNDTVQLTATGGVRYDWTPGLYLSDSTSATPVARAVTNIDYTLLITDQYGCYDTLGIEIIVHPEAILELGESKTIYPGESVQMNPGTNCLYFAWSPPLGLNADTIANPIAQPPVNTRYFVTAATEWGCTATDSVDVMVNPESLLDLPNAFTAGSYPNGTIKIVRRGLANLNSFRIFNRWGTKVFETKDIDQGWDGTFNGEPQPMGVYVYIIEATTNTGRRFTKQGNITLLR